MKLVTVFERPELNAMQYPVMVEQWRQISEGGSARRKYHATFTEAERKVIQRYSKIFYKWYLSTGTPAHHAMKIETYNLLKRAIQFFAGL